MSYLYLKSIHIIFVVSWMAGLFYIVRLFIYHTEANQKPEPDRSILLKQFQIMEKKLWTVIATPAMILTLASGFYMMFQQSWHLQLWMQVKLAFVAGLLIYHFICQNMMEQFQKGLFNWSSTKLRIWNEVATIFLVGIVFPVVLKTAMDWLYGLLGLILFAMIIMSAVKLYKYYRLKS